ncbi:MAG TPA: hypothetical protein RMH99_20070 [Sandaracinaceae bacterium LLY-WYZ-13_1]|nr:hypothetical protein [Sandaracinaceae bacterium LLY-WYZ-13_1]
MRRAPGFLAVLVLALSSFAAPAAAQPAVEEQLSSIRELIFAARFSDAVGAARAYLDRTDLSAEDRNAGLEVLAIAQIANRQNDEAEQTLRRLYARDPGHRLNDPDASPPVISAFARARESAPDPITVRIHHDPPTLTRREPPTLEVRLGAGDDAVSEVRLNYRAGPEGTARVVMTRRSDGTYVARIPVVGDATAPLDVAYHIVALAPSRAPLASLGSPSDPLQLRIPAEGGGAAQASTGGAATLPPPTGPVDDGEDEGGSVAEQWWFWTLIGLVVVGGAVTTGILLGPARQGPEEGTLGTVTLMQLEL